MSLIPSFSLVGWASAGALLAGLAGGAYISNNIKNTEIANIKLTQSLLVIKQSQEVLDNIKDATRIIHDQAISAKSDYAEYLSLKPNQQEFKNATKNPLSVGCKPDGSRLQYINAATAAANKAISGSKPSNPLSTNSNRP